MNVYRLRLRLMPLSGRVAPGKRIHQARRTAGVRVYVEHELTPFI